ncbi:Eco57I restriction-modification methylase domain-containing protein [Sphaerotilus sp.]|uniref:Eco57I restriction-modification methylase domain-containing protein n=1 Tax=Sphaerotilus sp. TaxID=2093942 RepID=UPI0025D906D4|nr:N-6 DNA methylase [Sphaerotilus sp.]
MSRDLFPSPWLVNTLLDEGFVSQQRSALGKSPIPHDLVQWLERHFDADVLSRCSEAQLEDKFIGPLLTQLGWTTVAQQSLTVQGKLAKPDWCLVLQPGQDDALIASKDHTRIQAICESKAWGKTLDTGKASREHNPHHQLQDYLSTLRVRFGFLTNGHLWRVYDTDKITARKTFIQFDLRTMLALEAGAERTEALALFAFFFGRDTYVPPAVAGQPSAIEQALAASADFTLDVEENLKAVIYGYAGEDSLFERMGRAIHRASPEADMASVYENSVVLLFRLLFVVYFEDKNRDLLARHPFYGRYSLEQIFRSLPEQSGVSSTLHDGVYALKHLFEIIDEGAEDIDIPLFNGGLFDPQRAPLLLRPKIFDNATLRQIFEKLLYKTNRGTTLFDTRRDFKNMSVTHLGRIYEGLLEFRFEKAAESAVYLEYESAATRGKSIEAYFDAYDTALIRKEKGFRALREVSVKKGDVYLKSASNSRKTSASYYTPTSLSEPLVKASVDRALSAAGVQAQGKALMDLKILDNACGSGHFLVEALNYLTDLALARLDTDADLQQLVTQENAKIAEQLKFLNIDYAPDDAQILKRALLKRCIFGVDLNPFAVELARLSLWMDSFIFGTPLSFIEHHVQHGNALMGSSVQEFIAYNATEAQQNDLFVDNLSARFDELHTVMQALGAMRDTTAAEVAQSKQLWKDAIAPKLNLLSRALSFLCTRRAMLAEGDANACEALSKTPNLVNALFDASRGGAAALRQVEAYARKYRFFHYEVAFPEAFAGARKGFDIIVGNPPWDKTKFSDTDFFPQYHSNYRSLKNTEKAAVQARLLESGHIAAVYRDTIASQDAANAYYKDKKVFPLNKGAGDGNLFRLFVERNLGLLCDGGNLSYVLPSALMFEEGSTGLRKHIFSNCRMVFFYSFENRKPIFPDVDSRYKFALMQLVNTPPVVEDAEDQPIDTAFYLLDAADLLRPEVHVAYPLATVKALSPEQWALMELSDKTDLPILQKCYGAFPALSADWLDFRRELHMTDDKDLFIEKPAFGLLPLYEGKMVWQYSHVFDGPQYWLDRPAFDERLRKKELHRMAQDLACPKAAVAQHAGAVRYDRASVRLAFREIARDTDERTLIFGLLPKDCGLGHTLFANAGKTYWADEAGAVQAEFVSPLRLLFALAWFNSLPADWLARFMVQIHVSLTYLYRLPIPQPSDADIRANADYAQLAKNALLLTLAAGWDDFAELAPLFGVERKDVPLTAKARDTLRVQNDKTVARLYGLTDAEFAHLLRSFKGMATKRPEYVALLQ